MRNIILLIILILVFIGIGAYVITQKNSLPAVLPANTTNPNPNENNGEPSAVEDMKVIATGLEIPWDIAFLPNGDMLVTERPGRLTRINPEGNKTDIPLDGVRHQGEGGLLGITLHPNFGTNGFLYIYMTAPGQNGQTENRVERYKLSGNSLTDEKIIIEDIPGAIYHDGGRMEFGKDGKLYITTGDATNEALAQNLNSTAGKILRLNDDGSIPSDNPFGTAIYSYGHRNPQGLAWDSAGRLWETEHGRSGVLSGLDEINMIEKGKNYGWPTIEGDETQGGMTAPVRHSGARDTWAPASAVILNNSLFFGGLLGEALYEAVLEGTSIKEFKTHFKNEFGRIRTVRIGPDNMLYITTSNRDGRGTPQQGDDKIIRINPASLK